jgi:putative ABC transport system permease protein
VFLASYMTKNGLTDTISFAPPTWLVLGTLVFALIVAVLSGLYPARRASNMDPIEALASI